MNVPHYLILRYIEICAQYGFDLRPGAQILDFGCGSGGDVYLLRDAGFAAFGCDFANVAQPRCAADRELFSVLPRITMAQEGKPDHRIDRHGYRLPYPDETFDLVVSGQVMEHVTDHAAVLSEIARILRPHGLSVHVFPPKFHLVEPHVYVPGGTLFKSRLYFLFWALMGVRNEYQHNLGAWGVAKMNAEYVRTGVNYVAPWRLRRLGRRWFKTSEFAPAIWERRGPLEKRLATSAFARELYTLTKNVVWVLGHPHATDRTKWQGGN